METQFGGSDCSSEVERPQSPATTTPAIEVVSSASARLCRSHTLRLHKTHAAPTPSPYLDVLSIQSRRLVAQTQAQIAAHEAQVLAQRGHDQECRRDAEDSSESEEALRLNRLLESVRLLIEPIQIPDLSHTGVFHDSVSQLQPTFERVQRGAGAPPNATLTLSSVEKESDIKLFYPTGAKKANMREYIKETIQRHLATDSTQSCADLPLSHQTQVSPSRSNTKLGVSASAPAFVLHASSSLVSQSPTKSGISRSDGGAKASVKKPATKSPLKHKKPKPALASPTAKSACSSPLLNPELTRQAKDIIAAVRANSSKINELMSS